MAPTITRLQLENAARDADDLGKIANEPDDYLGTGLVETRFGGPVKTIQKVISDINVTGDATNTYAFEQAERAEAAASSLEALGVPFATKALAQAYSPVVAPTYITIMGYIAAGDGGGARYKQVVSEPSHAGKFSITLDDGVTVVWFEINERTVNVKMFGAIGDNTADDTASIQAAINFGVFIDITIAGTYKITNEIVLLDNQYIRLLAGVVIRQYTASKAIFIATAKAGITIDCNNAVLYGEGTYGGNVGGGWTGPGNSNDRAINLKGCINCTVIRPHIKNCGLAGIAIQGGNGHRILFPKIEGTNLYSTAITYEGNFQCGIFVSDTATYGVTTNLMIVGPDISGAAHGILIESYPSLTYDGRLIQIIAPNIHDITGQHGFYIQSGGIVITNPSLRNIVLSGVKVQTSADNNLDIFGITITDLFARNIGSNMIELADLGAGSINNVRFSAVGEIIGTGVAIVGNVNDVRGSLVLNRVISHAVLMQGDSPDDIEIDVFARRVGKSGIVITATNCYNIRLHPVLRNCNDDNAANEHAIYIASNAQVDIFDPDITDSNARMRYAIANTASGIVRLLGQVELAGWQTGMLLTSGGPITGNFWQPYTPTVAPSAGAITTSSATGEWRQDNDIVYFKAIATVTTNGTGSGLLRVGLPKAAAGDYVGHGRETALTGNSLNAEIPNGNVYASVAKYDGTYPAANGSLIRIEGFYKAAS